MSENLSSTNKKRLGWLDALRGFTMLLVVANHVALKSFDMQIKWSYALQFFLLFRMPLFFFISGFLAYKASLVWDARTLGRLSLKKMRIQLIPTIVFFLLFLLTIPTTPFMTNLNEALASSMKAGYWFTLVLLYMLLTYYVFCYLTHRLSPRLFHVAFALLFLVSLACFETCYLPRQFSWALGHKGPSNAFMSYSSMVEMFRYFPFFLFGNIVHRHWERVQRLMDSPWLFPVVTVLAVVCTFDVLKWHNLRMEWTALPHTLSMFLLLSIVFMFFRHYHAFFEQTRAGLGLQYIGRRTLDIYLLHYFFLPKLPAVGAFFRLNRHNFVLDTTLSMAIALIVIAFCVLTSNILRISPFFKKYLFGRS